MNSETETLLLKSDVNDGRKSLTCEVCNLDFTANKQLKDHTKFKHKNEGKTILCSICNGSFMAKWDLKQHISTVHEDKRVLRKIIF